MNFHQIKGEKDLIYTPMGHLVNSSEQMKSGLYKVSNGAPPMQPFAPRFSPIDGGDGLIKFEGGVMHKILEKFGTFFSKETEEKYKTLKITHKMGAILHGPPGTGKTALAKMLMMQEVEKHNAVCIDVTDIRVAEMIYTVQLIRKHGTLPIIIFCDEFEEVANTSILLTFLDGVFSIDNIIFLGCTNFPELIPKRIINRRSRIKHVFEIKSLESAVYKEYISKKLPDMEKKILDEYVYKAAAAELTIDQLKNSLIDFYVDGDSIDTSIEEAKKIIIDKKPEEEEEF